MGTCNSSATRRATARAAIRRGWVQPTMPPLPRPAARHSLGSWVVLPEPVSPATTSTWCRRSNATISSALAGIGSSAGTSGAGSAGGGGMGAFRIVGWFRGIHFPPTLDGAIVAIPSPTGVEQHGQEENRRPDPLDQGNAGGHLVRPCDLYRAVHRRTPEARLSPVDSPAVPP